MSDANGRGGVVSYPSAGLLSVVQLSNLYPHSLSVL